MGAFADSLSRWRWREAFADGEPVVVGADHVLLPDTATEYIGSGATISGIKQLSRGAGQDLDIQVVRGVVYYNKHSSNIGGRCFWESKYRNTGAMTEVNGVVCSGVGVYSVVASLGVNAVVLVSGRRHAAGGNYVVRGINRK